MKTRGMLTAALALVLTACTGGPGDPDAPGSSSLRVPAEAASIIGSVTQVEGHGARGMRILVQQDSTRSAGEPIAWVDVAANARVLERRDGRTARADVATLAVGTRVSVWFTGAVRESFPVQADAGTIVIER
jgi:hypothetical protein